MREELVRAGIEETRTAEEVDATLARPGTTLLVVNSICGCAAGKMRPGVRLALTNAATSARSQDHRLCRPGSRSHRARPQLLRGQPAQSPAVAILRDGKLVYLMQRSSSSRPRPSRSPASSFALSMNSAPRHRLKRDLQLCMYKNGLPAGRPFGFPFSVAPLSPLLRPAVTASPEPCCASPNSRSRSPARSAASRSSRPM